MTVTENPEAAGKAQEIDPGKPPTETSKVSSEQPKTYTKESEEMAVHQALSEAGREAGVIVAKSTEAQQILEAAQTIRAEAQAEQGRWQSERDEASREAVRDDPEALKSLDERIRQRNEAAKLAKERAELVEREAKHKSDLEQIRVFKRTQLAAEVAVAKGVNLNAILKLTTEDSREAMEATAELLPKTGETKPPLLTDTSTTIGGSKIYKSGEVINTLDPNTMTPQQIHQQVLEIEKAEKEGRIK